MLAAEIAIRAAGFVSRLGELLDWRQACGYFASVLVLATFWMRQMAPLRVVAICSNVAFFSYAVLLGLPPVAILHAILLPVNVWRLYQLALNRYGQDDSPAGGWKVAGLAAKGAAAIVLSLLFVGAASSNTSDDEIHCKVQHWREWSPACRRLAKTEYLFTAHEIRAGGKRMRRGPRTSTKSPRLVQQLRQHSKSADLTSRSSRHLHRARLLDARR